MAKQLEGEVRKEWIIEIYGTFYCSLSIVLHRILRILVILTCLHNIIWKLISLYDFKVVLVYLNAGSVSVLGFFM